MRIHTLEARATIGLPRERVFACFADAANLERITPPRLRLRILTPLPISMREGSLIDCWLRLLHAIFRYREIAVRERLEGDFPVGGARAS